MLICTCVHKASVIKLTLVGDVQFSPRKCILSSPNISFAILNIFYFNTVMIRGLSI